jgi:hypothetical protein
MGSLPAVLGDRGVVLMRAALALALLGLGLASSGCMSLCGCPEAPVAESAPGSTADPYGLTRKMPADGQPFETADPPPVPAALALQSASPVPRATTIFLRCLLPGLEQYEIRLTPAQ